MSTTSVGTQPYEKPSTAAPTTVPSRPASVRALRWLASIAAADVFPVVQNATKYFCGIEVNSRQNELYGTTIAFGALALIAVSVRLANRLPTLGGGFGMDDYFIVAAMVSRID